MCRNRLIGHDLCHGDNLPLTNLESKQALAHAINMGRGGVFLNLTSAQYAKLKTQ